MGDLRVGNALHTAKNGVEKDDAHSDIEPKVVVGLKKTGKCNAHAFHLSDHVCDGDDDEADDGNDARGF